jgi:HSP20 family protein
MLPDAFEALFNLQSALDAYRQSDWLERSTTGAGPFPPVNAFRKGDDFVIIAEVPGVKKSDLDSGQRSSDQHRRHQIRGLRR